jgi:hypothetical protein
MTWLAFTLGAKKFFGSVIEWIKHNGVAVLLLCLGAFTGLALLRRKDSQVTDLKSALEIQKAKATMDSLKQQKAVVLQRDAIDGRKDAALAIQASQIEQQIEVTKKKIAALHSGKHEFSMTDEEAEAFFRDAGL